MATRLIGTDSANPRLPAVVIAATQGTTAADLAPGDVLADANAYTDAQIEEIVAGGVNFADTAETVAGTSTNKAVTPAGRSGAETTIDPRRYGLATSATPAVNRAALQAAIDEACGPGDPVTTTRSAGRAVVIPAGQYQVDAPITIRSVMNLVVRGEGDAVIVAAADMASVFDINGMAFSRFGGLTIIGLDATVQVTDAIYTYWDQTTAAFNNSANSYHDITIRNLDFVTAIRVGKAGSNLATDNDEYRNININGAWAAGDTTRWQNGILFGTGVGANNLVHHLYKYRGWNCRYPIKVDRTQLAVYGAGLAGCEAAIHISPFGYLYFNGLDVEVAQRLMVQAAAGGYPVNVTISDSVFRADASMAADGEWIRFYNGGTLLLEQMTLTGAPVIPRVVVGNSIWPTRLDVNGLCVQWSTLLHPNQCITLGDPKASARVRGFVNVDGTGSVTRVVDWDSGEIGSTLTLGNNVRTEDSTLTLNSKQTNTLAFNHVGNQAWLVYDAGSTQLFFRDAINGNMHLAFAPGSATTGRVDVGCKLLVTAPAGIQMGNTGGPSWKSGAGSPEGVVYAEQGSLYSRTDGGAGTSLYVKQSGGGANTGWIGK
jgi:hypothetical protein